MHISIIAVGGTIDKVYFDAKSQYEVGPPNIARVLGELNLAVSYSVTSLMRKDSLDLTEHDRQIIFTAVRDDPAQRILITHGTDTMVQTALHLKPISQQDHRPHRGPGTGPVQDQRRRLQHRLRSGGGADPRPGVYIAMNGAVFAADRVRKNLATNRFEEIAPL